MKVLVLSPTYASHYAPLAVIGRAARECGHRVVVATGTAFRERVERDGFEHRSLRLGAETNVGTATLTPDLRAFITATRGGAMPALRHQSERRARDLLWEPKRVGAEIVALCDAVDPDLLLVDHVSFASTLGAVASGHPFATFVPGHPSQLPVGDECYGVPVAWPGAIEPDAAELDDLRSLARAITVSLTEQWNGALASIAPDRSPVADATRVTGRRVLYNSVSDLVPDERRVLLPADHRFVGPLVREESDDGHANGWRTDCDAAQLRVVVAFGTFLSWRSDVLGRVAAALRRIGARAAIAIGQADPGALGPIPPRWIVADRLPQVALLSGSDIVIHHGGNNSVQECLAAGVRQIVLPFSTDQFDNAADLERTGNAVVLCPNRAGVDEIADAALTLADRRPPSPRPRPTPDELASALVGPPRSTPAAA